MGRFVLVCGAKRPLLQSSTLATAICRVKSSQYSNFLKTSSGPLGSLGGSSEPTEPPCLRACQAYKNASLSLANVVWYVLHTVQSRSSVLFTLY